MICWLFIRAIKMHIKIFKIGNASYFHTRMRYEKQSILMFNCLQESKIYCGNTVIKVYMLHVTMIKKYIFKEVFQVWSCIASASASAGWCWAPISETTSSSCGRQLYYICTLYLTVKLSPSLDIHRIIYRPLFKWLIDRLSKLKQILE